MSNPLIRPNDPRFQKPEIRNAEGKNRFAEGVSPEQSSENEKDVFAAAASDDERPYQPRYAAQQQPRSARLIALGGLGWIAAALGAISLTGLFVSGSICPLLGLGPSAAAWLLAWEDLKAIRAGAIEEEARPQTRLALGIGLAAFVASAGIVAAMVYRQMNFFPSVF